MSAFFFFFVNKFSDRQEGGTGDSAIMHRVANHKSVRNDEIGAKLELVSWVANQKWAGTQLGSKTTVCSDEIGAKGSTQQFCIGSWVANHKCARKIGAKIVSAF